MTVGRALELAVGLHRRGRLDEAERIYRQVLQQEPDDPDALQLLGLIERDRGRHERAVELIGRAAGLRPGVSAYRSKLGLALRGAGRPAEAAAAYRTAIELDPSSADDHVGLGQVLKELGELDEAIAAYHAAIRIDPSLAAAHAHLGFAMAVAGDLDAAIGCYRRAIALEPRSPGLHSQLLQTFLYHPGYDASAILKEHLRWNRQHAEPLTPMIQPHPNDRDPDRPLRIGYVSADFRNHACAYCLEHLMAAHDPSRFEIVCYAEVPFPDDVTGRIRAHARLWRDTAGVPDDRLAAQIRADRIDILVDLKVHTAENRLTVFAHRPAPVQVTWMGYPGTTGMSAIAYRLSDPHLDPPGLNDRFYTEETVRLPDCFWCYEPGSREPTVGPPPAARSGFIQFGCLNNFCKVNEPLLELWARILGAVEGSRLMILCDAGSHRDRTLGVLARHGVDPDRVRFEPRRERRRYLELYHEVDIALDTFPYCGVTTSLDGMLMGVPVVTRAGQTAVSRGGLSILSNLGLTDLVAHDPDDYVGIAVRLAGDRPRREHLRATLRGRLEASPLMNPRRFARGIEDAYRTIWRRWCAGGGRPQNTP